MNTARTNPTLAPMGIDDAREEVRACLDAYERAMERSHPDWMKHIGMVVEDAAGQARWVLEQVRPMSFGKVGAAFVDTLAMSQSDALMHYAHGGERILRDAFTARYPWLPAGRLVILGGGCILYTDEDDREGEATARALGRR